MSLQDRHRETRRFEFYRDGFRLMLPVFTLLVVIAAALAVALSMTVFMIESTAAYAAENGKITPLPVFEDPRQAHEETK